MYNLHYTDRGYENLEEKLKALGARIKEGKLMRSIDFSNHRTCVQRGRNACRFNKCGNDGSEDKQFSFPFS